MIDILVKVRLHTLTPHCRYSPVHIAAQEVADRRDRRNPNDRRLISERTAKSLRTQAAPLHIYRGRSNVSRAAQSRLLSISDLDDLSASDEDLDTMTQVEGARVNSELYNALMPTMSFSIPRPGAGDSSSATTPEVERERVTSPRPVSPPFTGLHHRNSWLSGSRSSGSGLSGLSPPRHTVRRPIRSRIVDFNDFTLRRRSDIRNNSADQDSSHSVRSEDAEDGTWRFRPFSGDDTDPTPSDPSSGSYTTTSATSASVGPTPRRFFSPLAARRHEVGSGEPWSSEPRDPPPAARAFSDILQSSSSSSSGQTWTELWSSLSERERGSHSPSPLSGTSNRTHSEERRPVVPRLRRGGLRAPEVLSSTYSPSRMLPSPQSLLSEPARSDGETNEWRTIRGRGPGIERDPMGSEGHEVWASQESTEQLLTPRSISPVGLGSQSV